MNKKIVFRASTKTAFDTHEKPYPASNALPKWWKTATPYEIEPGNPDGKKFIMRNRMANTTFKKCTPMLDGLTSGYIVPLWADVQITQEGESPYITWRTKRDVFQIHGDTTRSIPAPPGYSSQVFKYLNCWIPETPLGYSVLVTPPFGYQDTPFRALPAVIDSDKSTLEVLFPVWVSNTFEGIVEHGTPMVQLIPFKRDDWKAEFAYYEDGVYHNIIEEKNFNKTLINHYIKHHWSKKNYK